jgi:hypothetical protein
MTPLPGAHGVEARGLRGVEHLDHLAAAVAVAEISVEGSDWKLRRLLDQGVRVPPNHRDLRSQLEFETQVERRTYHI